MSSEPLEIDLEAILNRVADHMDTKKDTELAEGLGVTPQTLANWRRREKVPFEALCIYGAEEGLDLNYLILGKEQSVETVIESSLVDPLFLAIAGLSFEQALAQEAVSPVPDNPIYYYLGLLYNKSKLAELELPSEALRAQLREDSAKMAALLKIEDEVDRRHEFGEHFPFHTLSTLPPVKK